MNSPLLTTRLVMFDLDGTLADTITDLTHAINAMLSTMGKQPVAASGVRMWIGNGVDRLVMRALQNGSPGNPDEQIVHQAVRLFREHYRMHLCDSSQLYPGAFETLSTLKHAGLKLACVTNKAYEFTRPLLTALGIDGLFNSLMCGDQVERKKPDPMLLLQTCARSNTHPSDSLMIGDSANDLRAAKAAHIPVICVSYGYNLGQDLTGFENVKMIDRLTEILQLVELDAGIRTRSSI